MTNLPPLADARDRLNRRYTHVRTQYDRLATRYKRLRMRMWLVTLIATWGPLILAVIGLGHLLDEWWNHFLLHRVIPLLGSVNFTVTMLQVVASPRGRWLEYRAATEQLREQAMRFRTGLAPYDGPDADSRFDRLLDGLTRRLGRDDPHHPRPAGSGWLRPALRAAAFWRLTVWKIFVGRIGLAVRGLPADLRDEVPHPPDDGLFPQLADLAPAERVSVVMARLRNQRQWHLKKSGRYYSWYLTFQLLISGSGAFVAGYSYFVGRSFVWYGVATAVSLSLMAWRDFLECASLSMRYFQLARSLGDLEDRLLKLSATAGVGGVSSADLAEIVDEGERLIGSEFRSWKLVQETVPTD